MLRPGERLNRDFILRYPVAREKLATSLHCHAASGEQPGTFALTLCPPAAQGLEKPAPRRVVFLLDRSGSMEGWKMVAARRALGRMIDTLLDQDQFTVVAFDSVVEQPPNALSGCVAGNNRERWQMLEWLGKVDARGGTEMGPALQTALRLFPKHTDSYRSILVLITDGQVTGEDAILRSLARFGQESLPRIFTVGIDRAVNAGFLRKLADFGQGDCELVESEDRLDEAMDRIHRLIGTPLLTQVRVEAIEGTWIADSQAPRRLPDLYVDRPLTVFGRHRDEQDCIRVRVYAVDAAGRPWQEEVTGRAAPASLLVSMWGRAKVRDLEDEYAAGQSRNAKALMDGIVRVSLESHVLSRFTAYVAVDKSDVVNPDGRPLEVIQPVEYPDGWATGGRVMRLACAAPASLASSEPPPAVLRKSRSLLSRAYDALAELAVGESDAELSAPMVSQPMSPPADLTDVLPQDLADLLSKKPQEAGHVLELLLDEAIQSRASQISLHRHRGRIRVQLLLNGKWIDRTTLPEDLWEQLLEAIQRRSGIDPSSTSWPQQGEIRWHNFALVVTITRARKRETVLIEIPPAAAGTQGPSDTSRTSAEKRTRFWT